jgi:preprotein translocase subunit SecE
MATPEVQTVSPGAEKAKLLAVLALVVLSVAAFYLLASQSLWIRWTALLLALGMAVVVFFVSEAGKRLSGFGKDAVRETKKVVWPERREAMQITAYVFAFVVVMALFLWMTDKTIEWVFYDLLLGWRK